MSDNMAKRPKFQKNSRSRHYNVVYDKDIQQYRLGFYNFKVLKSMKVNETTDHVYYVEPATQHRLDLISMKFYGTTVFDWVIAEVNNISDPIKDIKTGLKLIIPNPSRLVTGV